MRRLPFPERLRSLRRVLPSSRVRAWVFTIALGLLGGVIAVLLAGNVQTTIGPFDATLSARPALSGSTNVNLAPLGALALDTHSGPTELDVSIDRIDLDRAQQLLNSADAVASLEQDAGDSTKSAVISLALKCVGLAFAGGAVFALIGRRRVRNVLVGGVSAAVLVGGTFGVAAATLNTNALSEPRFTGVLTLAPQAIGDVRDVTNRFGLYRDQINELVANLSRLYETANSGSTVDVNENSVRILHVSDLHLNPAGFDLIQQLVTQFKPDAIIDTGDINDWGTSFEGSFADQISGLGVPYVFIRGNHDSQATQASVAAQPNAIVLDNTTTEVEGIRIWGIGDPRYTADKQENANLEAEREVAQAAAPGVLRGFMANQPPLTDIALVHDPSTGTLLADQVPLVLSGHLHTFDQRQLGQTTTLLIQGSTGAAGLRGVTDSGSTPLSASMLYFDRDSRKLTAYDHISVEGLGGSGAQIDRHIMASGAPVADDTTTTTEDSAPAPLP